jgi:protoporphyrinogen oxidase
LIQHTNFIKSSNYANHHILYAANYVEEGSRLLSMTKDEIVGQYLPHLLKINKNIVPLKTYLFKASFAQPIFDADFLSHMPQFETPNKKIYIANLDMTYPYDRGTNYAVKLGRDVAGLL